MPVYVFEYYDEKGERHIFEEMFPVSSDFEQVTSPCGKFKAHKIPAVFNNTMGMTAAQKRHGTTKNRIEMGKFMQEQRDVRKKNYAPGTREHDSNEMWTGVEGKDGITQMPVNPPKKENI
jgi:hypothetical protein